MQWESPWVQNINRWCEIQAQAHKNKEGNSISRECESMEQRRYCAIIYGLKLRLKNMRQNIGCEYIQDKTRKIYFEMLNDIEELIKDYEKV